MYKILENIYIGEDMYRMKVKVILKVKWDNSIC